MTDVTTGRDRAGVGGFVRQGLVAVVAAMAVTFLAAALAQAVGVDFLLPEGGEKIPLAGFAVVTGVFSLAGVGIAAAFRRWSARPARGFIVTAVTLTTLSLVAPLLSGGNAGTVVALLVLHLVPAAVVIPALARALKASR